MYGVELMARRKTLGLDLTQTAQLCQVAAGQVQAWEQGTDPVGQNVAGVLRDAEDECAAISEAIMEHAFELAEIEEDELAETLFLGWVFNVVVALDAPHLQHIGAARAAQEIRGLGGQVTIIPGQAQEAWVQLAD